MTKLRIHYDPEGDVLEVRFGKVTPSYYEDVGNDTFERRDEETDRVTGYKFFNVKKSQEIEVDLPA